MNAKLAILLISAGLGAAGGLSVAITAGWGLIGGLLMYSVGGSLSLFAASLLLLASEGSSREVAHG